jgi:lipid-A-disaccharide synthase
VKVRTANLVNLISDQDVVPEFLQEYCSVDSLSAALQPLLTDPETAQRQRIAFDEVMQVMGRGGMPPAHRAAQSVLRFLENA